MGESIAEHKGQRDTGRYRVVGDIFRRNIWENLPIEGEGEKERGLSKHSHISHLCSGLDCSAIKCIHESPEWEEVLRSRFG